MAGVFALLVGVLIGTAVGLALLYAEMEIKEKPWTR